MRTQSTRGAKNCGTTWRRYSGAAIVFLVVMTLLLGREETPDSAGKDVLDSPPAALAPVAPGGSETSTEKPASDTRQSAADFSVRLAPLPAFPGTTLQVEVAPDDAAERWEYVWYRNDEVIAGANEARLETTGFRKGELLAVEVFPVARGERGSGKKSLPVLLHNCPPAIDSSPPAVLQDGRYFYRVHAVDPDGDKLSYTLEESPAGMTIDPVTGQIDWSLPPGTGGKQQVRVVVSDGDAKCFQQFSLGLIQ